MHQCPKCGSAHIHRSRAKSKWETLRKAVTGKRPYRCRACGWRGWGVDDGPRLNDPQSEFASRAEAPTPANLQGTALARDDHRLPDINLDALDAIDALEPAGNRRK
jgi:predicted RNA-binding Zn-ribbon protein involved in translation (DUF1610 family)